MRPIRRRGGLPGALALTLASALLWGVAHLWTGRRLAGTALFALYATLIGCAALAVDHRPGLLNLAVRPDWLAFTMAGSVVLALLWTGIVVRSWFLVRPGMLPVPLKIGAFGLVGVLCLVVSAPFAFAAHATFLYRDALLSIFGATDDTGAKGHDPWADRRRLNVLLLGGDAGHNRYGVRTDSVTLASIDTHTGDTVLLSLPRNLERVPLPPGPAAQRFPHGFTGDGPQTPGLLNEIYQYAEDHPEMTPGAPQGQRGPALLLPTVSGVLGQPIDYHVLVDMRGFARLIDAMGGVRLTIPEDITFGRNDEGTLPAGRHLLSGSQALWYGRSRTASDDYTRMGRQKCLLRAIARQADAQRLLTRFQGLAATARHAISTDLPPSLLPASLELAEKVKNGGRITSLQFVPPLVDTAHPDFELIRTRAAQAIADSGRTPAAPPSASPSPAAPAAVGSPDPDASAKAVSLDATCPS